MASSTYFDFVDYDSDNGDIRFVFYGERLNQFINDSWDIQNRFQILDEYGYEITWSHSGWIFHWRL